MQEWSCAIKLKKTWPNKFCYSISNGYFCNCPCKYDSYTHPSQTLSEKQTPHQ